MNAPIIAQIYPNYRARLQVRSTMLEAGVTAVTITNDDGHILATAGRALSPAPRNQVAADSLQVIESPDALLFYAPIFQNQTEVEEYLYNEPAAADSHAPPRVLGQILVEISRLSSVNRKNQLILNSLLITLAGLALAALLALRMAREVTQPIMVLASAVNRMGRGDLNIRVQTRATGELAVLERGVNNMAVALKAVQDAQEERRAILATVLDSINALVYVADMHTYEVLFVNKYAQETFGNIAGQVCWQALQKNQSGPCAFCTNKRLLRPDGMPDAPVIWEFQNTVNQHWYLIQDSAIKWVDDRIVRLEIATDITENKQQERHIRQLEHQIMDISEKERERIGHELHDGLGQQLTGIAFLSKALAHRLASQSLPEGNDANQIVSMINQAISETRQLARGLQPVEVAENGLMSALETLAQNIKNLLHLDCEFHCATPVLVPDSNIANHLYRIAQEAVNNAIKHGKARHIEIELKAPDNRVQLSIHDDGTGFHTRPTGQADGMGLQIMRYRANMIGATLDIETEAGQGTLIKVHF